MFIHVATRPPYLPPLCVVAVGCWLLVVLVGLSGLVWFVWLVGQSPRSTPARAWLPAAMLHRDISAHNQSPAGAGCVSSSHGCQVVEPAML